MIFTYLFVIGVLSELDGLERISEFENSIIDTRSFRYNASCDALENSKLCEDNCGQQVQDCSVACNEQGQC